MSFALFFTELEKPAETRVTAFIRHLLSYRKWRTFLLQNLCMTEQIKPVHSLCSFDPNEYPHIISSIRSCHFDRYKHLCLREIYSVFRLSGQKPLGVSHNVACCTMGSWQLLNYLEHLSIMWPHHCCDHKRAQRGMTLILEYARFAVFCACKINVYKLGEIL